ncbi:hypothetical protein [Henriciella sp.]|jgi:hypothetical protein|uniref:hypothetical protein n=1 Tax=Henriciella sp. TaxID=1968823 RepID=UPI000C3E9A1A|nr:hypothetical protein [Henriciella sp.]MAN73680.1 hypothetical protein [Henriciella sp.]|tara:strand:+ start:27414 stop:27827 length:414 start_codon:yes stop_codon:yes gene_type:complete
MKIWTRLMMIFAAAFLAAQPVMACPLMLSAAGTASATVNAGHPCSEMVMSEAGTTGQQEDPSSDCPAGYDCAPMLIQAQSDANPPAISVAPEPVFIALVAAPYINFPPERRVLKTGPPPGHDFPLFTPVTLKQRLLN